MEAKPNLARDWWAAAVAAAAAIFTVHALLSIVAILRPVPPSLEQDLIYAAVIVAGGAILLVLASRFAFAERLRPFVRRLLFVALGSGTLLALWMLAAFPVHLSADAAYANDAVCSSLGQKNTASGLCSTGDGRVVAAYVDKASHTFFLTVLAGERAQTVQLECPGDQLFTWTVASTKTVRVNYYGRQMARLGAGGLICETSFAPSPHRTYTILLNTIFGLLVASYAAWALWGDRIAAFLAARRARRKSSLPET